MPGDLGLGNRALVTVASPEVPSESGSALHALQNLTEIHASPLTRPYASIAAQRSVSVPFQG